MGSLLKRSSRVEVISIAIGCRGLIIIKRFPLIVLRGCKSIVHTTCLFIAYVFINRNYIACFRIVEVNY